MNLPKQGLILLVFFLFAGCASSENNLTRDIVSDIAHADTAKIDTEKSLAQGEQGLMAGDHEAAYESFARVLQEDSNNPEALAGLGESLLIGGEPKKALGVFAKLEEQPHHKAVAYQGQGLALLGMAEYAKAEVLLGKALKEDTQLWRSWNALGTIKDRGGDWAEAREDYERALEINPDAIEAINNRGISFLWEGKYLEAEKTFKEVLRRSPDLVEARTNLRMALAWQGKYVEALTGIRKKEMAVMLNNVGYIAMKRGDYEFAEAYLAQAMQMSPSYYAKAAENMEYLKQLKHAEKANKTDLSLEKKN
jgi:Flp pilus assembly protein TadD